MLFNEYPRGLIQQIFTKDSPTMAMELTILPTKVILIILGHNGLIPIFNNGS
jgi:hypothetical protein